MKLWIWVLPILWGSIGCANVDSSSPSPEATAAKTIQVQKGTDELLIELAESPHPETRSYWGSGDSPPTFPRKFSVIAQGEELIVPLSAFSDLSHIHRADIARKGKSLTLTLEGSDASEGYKAILVFENDSLVKREVRSGEFPNHHFEVTHYSNKNPEEDGTAPE